MAIAALTLFSTSNLSYDLSSVELPCPSDGDRTNRFHNQNIHRAAEALSILIQKQTPVLAFAGAGVSRLKTNIRGQRKFWFGSEDELSALGDATLRT